MSMNIPKGKRSRLYDQEMLRDVSAWMTAPAITVSMDTPLAEALAIMHDNRIRHLPIVLATGQICGVITDGDIRGADRLRMAGITHDLVIDVLRHSRVYQCMTEFPIVATTSTTLREAAILMLDNKISGLPVVDTQNIPIGMLSEENLFEALICYIDRADAT